MPSHQIFNERPESQDRALRELQAMGYQYIPRAEAEQKRGHLSHVLFPDVMREFLASQSLFTGASRPRFLTMPSGRRSVNWMPPWSVA